MIKVSNIDWQYIYWIDYSEQWAEVFDITLEQFNDIKNWLARIEDWVVIAIQKPEVTEEEVQALRKQELLMKINKVKEVSLAKRLEYTTVRDMLPEWNPIRELKLDKLHFEWQEILVEFETLVQELVTEFWPNALFEII